MIPAKGYAAHDATSLLGPFNFERREVGEYDVLIDILYCGVCHSDIHQVRNEWGGSIYPMVPGHEIVGRISKVGSKVTKFKVGDLGGVGCFVDSCRTCDSCQEGLEQYGKGHKVAIVGLGGLGHMAVKLAVSLGADVTVLSTSPGKKQDALDLGAHNFAVTKDPEQVKQLRNTFDFIVDTVSAPHDYNLYLGMLRRDGTMILLGVPPEPTPVAAFHLIGKRKRLVGSMIGGIKETQEMLDYCAEHNIMSDVEVIPIQKINEAYERTLKSDVRYRFVIDMASLENEVATEELRG